MLTMKTMVLAVSIIFDYFFENEKLYSLSNSLGRRECQKLEINSFLSFYLAKIG